MTEFAPWQMPSVLPPDSARAPDGRRLRIVPNPAVPVPSVLSTPLLEVECAPWVKPSASACFPLHPLGALVLNLKARKLLLDTGMATSMSPEQLDHAEACVWRFAAKLYRPGASIRSALDQSIEDRNFHIRTEDNNDPLVAQPAHLAAWLVLRAALDWAKEAGA